MMSELNIFKYEPPIVEERLSGGKKIRFSQNPNFHIYYKFPNAKNVPNMFNNSDKVVVTRKIHGTNARYGIVKKNKINIIDKIRKLFGNKLAYYEYVYGSHNVQKADDSQGYYVTNHWKEIDRKYDIKNKLWKLFKSLSHNGTVDMTNLIIYGEIYGPGIQGEKYTYGKKEIELACFDVEINNEYQDFISKQITFIELDLPKVPKLYEGVYFDELLTKYNDDKMDNGFPHEGVVITCVTGDRHKIMKVVSPHYTMASEKYSIPDSH